MPLDLCHNQIKTTIMKKLFLLLTTLTIFHAQLFGQGQVPLNTVSDHIYIDGWHGYNSDEAPYDEWNQYYTIVSDTSGNLYGAYQNYGFGERGLFGFDGENWTFWNENDEPVFEEDISDVIHQKSGDKIWIVTGDLADDGENYSGTKVVCFDDGVFEVFDETVFNSETLIDLEVSDVTGVWVLSTGGVYNYDGIDWTYYSSADNFIHPESSFVLQPFKMCSDDAGAIYVTETSTSQSVIFKFQDDVWSVFFIDVEDAIMLDVFLEVDQENTLWFFDASYAYKIDLSTSVTESFFVDFFAAEVSEISFDENNDMWLVSTFGILKMNSSGGIYNVSNNHALLYPFFGLTPSPNSISLSSEGEIIVGAGGVFTTNNPNDGLHAIIFHDLNEDGVQDEGEENLQGIYTSLEDSTFRITDVNGIASYFPANGTYDLNILMDYWYLTEPNSSLDLMVNNDDTLETNPSIGIFQYDNIPDATIDISPQTFVAGFDHTAIVSYINLGSQVMDGVIKVVLDPFLLSPTTTPTADFTMGDTLVWNYDNLIYGDIEQITVNSTVDVDALGLNVEIYAEITSNVGDSLWANNVAEIREVVVGSYDPNDKQVYPMGECDAQLMLADEELEYLVRFQNTGNWPATTVSIWDTLSPYLDLSTLVITSASHEVEVDFVHDRFIRFNFFDIMLPDSTSDEAGSHGFVKYSIQAKEDVAFGTEVNNTAHIFFDYNDPIVTNTTVNVLVDSVPLPPVFTISQNGDSLFVPEDDNLEYQWHNGGGVIVINETGFWLTPEWEGEYSVLVTDSNGCVQMSELYDFSFVALDEQLQSVATIAPNPFTDFTILSFNQPQKNVRVELIDIQGRVQQVYWLNGNELRIERDGLPTGMYLLRVAEESVNKIIID